MAVQSLTNVKCMRAAVDYARPHPEADNSKGPIGNANEDSPQQGQRQSKPRPACKASLHKTSHTSNCNIVKEPIVATLAHAHLRVQILA